MLYNYIQLIANLCSYCLILCSLLCTSTVIKADLCISRHNPVRALTGLLIGCFQSCVPMMWESQKGTGSEEQELSDICNGGNFGVCHFPQKLEVELRITAHPSCKLVKTGEHKIQLPKQKFRPRMSYLEINDLQLAASGLHHAPNIISKSEKNGGGKNMLSFQKVFLCLKLFS